MKSRRNALARCCLCRARPIYLQVFKDEAHILGRLTKDRRYLCSVCVGNLKPTQREALLRAA